MENTNDIEMENQDVQKPEVSLMPAPMADFGVNTHHPKWEKLLSKKIIIAAMEENPTSLKLKVKIETMDTAEKESITSLVDCGATREFIDWQYAKSNHFNLVKLSQPIPVYKNHSEKTTFAVSGLGKQKLILGHSWLWKHNLEIDWITREVKMPPLDAAQDAEI